MTTNPERPHPRFNRRHLGILAWLLEHPSAPLRECAEAMGYSRSWVSRIVNSPEFRERFQAIATEELKAAVRRRFEAYSTITKPKRRRFK